MINVLTLGAVKPNVKQAAVDVSNAYGVTTIYGVGTRDGVSDHPAGLALDFMVYKDSVKGDQVAEFSVQNASKYAVKYVIWKQRIWNVERASEGWRPMKDRGGVTANHFDHVHVSYYNRAVGGGTTNIPAGDTGIPNPITGAQDLAQIIQWIGNPKNWLRVAMFQLGAVLLIIALVLILANGNKVKASIPGGKYV